MSERWPRPTFVLDPEAGCEPLAQRIDRELDARVLTHSQKTNPMCRASQMLAEAIAEQALEHPDDEGLNRHVLSAAAKFYGVGWRFVKQGRKNLPLDACVALAMAVRVLNAVHDTPAQPRPGLRCEQTVVFT
jgi:hypothetical protein